MHMFSLMGTMFVGLSLYSFHRKQMQQQTAVFQSVLQYRILPKMVSLVDEIIVVVIVIVIIISNCLSRTFKVRSLRIQ
jgi:hypothetical protein